MAIQNSIDLTATGVITHDGSGVFTGSTLTQYQTLIGGASNAVSGVAVGTSGQVLTSAGAGSNPSYQDAAGGDVSGPVSSTDNALARWDGTGGDTLQDSSVIVTDNGEMTNTSQPAFCAYQGSTDSNVTGDNTEYILGDTSVGTTLTERFDQGGDFTPGASGGAVFTAPVTGKYQFNITTHLQSVTTAHRPGIGNIATSNQNYFFGGSGQFSSGGVNMFVSLFTDMDSADTIKVGITVFSSTKTVDIDGTNKTVFSGNLVC